MDTFSIFAVSISAVSFWMFKIAVECSSFSFKTVFSCVWVSSWNFLALDSWEDRVICSSSTCFFERAVSRTCFSFSNSSLNSFRIFCISLACLSLVCLNDSRSSCFVAMVSSFPFALASDNAFLWFSLISSICFWKIWVFSFFEFLIFHEN